MSASQSPIYGPVHSWRFGRSLGIDLILVSSVCTFDCTYCQLGRIREKTSTRREWVPTQRIVEELEQRGFGDLDVVTFSGNGEPTLASNLGECIRAVRTLTRVPAHVLTNSTLLLDPSVRADLDEADRVYLKLDAATDETLTRMNHPLEGIRLADIVEGMCVFRRQRRGHLAVQTMVTKTNLQEVDGIADLLVRIAPDEVFLNTPLRKVPREWTPGARGDAPSDDGVLLDVLTREQAAEVETRLRHRTGLTIVSVYSRG